MVAVPAKLVTIIVPFQSRSIVEGRLKAIGVSGFSAVSVEGSGAHGVKKAGFIDAANIQFTIVTNAQHSETLLTWVEKELSVHQACIAFAADVVAVPAKHFQ